MTVRKIKREFMKQAKLGNGRAYSIFMQNPKIDFTDCITELSLHNFGYDPQGEGDRADYALQFIHELSENQRKTVLDRIKKELSEIEIKDEWDIYHLFTLAALLSKEYDAEFGKIIVNRYETCSADELWNFSEISILILEGFDGMVRIARRCGKMLLCDERWWVSSSTMFCVPKMDGLDVWDKLKKLAETDKDIASYMNGIDKTENSRNERLKDTRSPFEQAKYYIERKKSHHVVPRRITFKLSREELCYFADKFKKAKTQKEKRIYIRMFDNKRVVYPYSPFDLLNSFSARKNSYFNECLVRVLEFFSAPEIRDLAEKSLASKVYDTFYLKLLVRNYREGDAKKILEKISAIKNPDDFHDAVYRLEEIYEENVTAECLEPLMLAYQNLSCGLCRQHVVEIMEKSSVLSDEIRAEFQHDSAYLYDKRTESE